MTTDSDASDVDALSRRLTAAARSTDGVTGVHPAQPLLEVAADALAARLSLQSPDLLVDVERSDGFVTVAVHIAASASRPAPETLRLVGERMLAEVDSEGAAAGGSLVSVRLRVLED